MDLDTNAVVHTLDHRQGDAPVPLTTLAVSADEQWLASGDGANGIRVFNLDTMQLHVSACHHTTLHNPRTVSQLGPGLTSTRLLTG